jgi:hypothetical protein
MLFSFRVYAFLALSSLSAVVAAPTRRDTFNNRAHVYRRCVSVLNVEQRSNPTAGPTRG